MPKVVREDGHSEQMILGLVGSNAVRPLAKMAASKEFGLASAEALHVPPAKTSFNLANDRPARLAVPLGVLADHLGICQQVRRGAGTEHHHRGHEDAEAGRPAPIVGRPFELLVVNSPAGVRVRPLSFIALAIRIP